MAKKAKTAKMAKKAKTAKTVITAKTAKTAQSIQSKIFFFHSLQHPKRPIQFSHINQNGSKVERPKDLNNGNC